MTDRSPSEARAGGKNSPGLTIGQKLITSFLGFLLVLGVLLVVVYRLYVPALVTEQVGLRVESVARLFGSAAFTPLLERDYLAVNKIAERTAELPDVAYAAVVNDQGVSVAGIFGDMGKFNPAFIGLAKQQGFPKEIVDQTRLPSGQENGKRTLVVGGEEIVDYGLRLPQTKSEVHVGLFTADVKAAERRTLVPLVILLFIMAAIGTLTLMLVARTVSRPIRALSAQAESISKGRLWEDVDIKAGGEVWELAQSFKRMQSAIRYAANQMQRRKQEAKQEP